MSLDAGKENSVILDMMMRLTPQSVQCMIDLLAPSHLGLPTPGDEIPGDFLDVLRFREFQAAGHISYTLIKLCTINSIATTKIRQILWHSGHRNSGRLASPGGRLT